MALRAVKPPDVEALVAGKAEIPNLEECAGLCKAVVSVAMDHGSDFLAQDLDDDCELALGLIGWADISLAKSAVETIEKLRSQNAAGDGQSGQGAVKGFFLEHVVGQQLVDLASSRVQDGEQGTQATESLEVLREQVSRLQQLPERCQALGLDLIVKDLQPVQCAIDNCSRDIARFKGSRDKETKETREKGEPVGGKRMRHRTYDRLMDTLSTHKSAFAEAALKLLRADLKANLSEHLPLALFTIPRL